MYGAGSKFAVASPKYGDYAREWKPFLPDPQTVGDLTSLCDSRSVATVP